MKPGKIARMVMVLVLASSLALNAWLLLVNHKIKMERLQTERKMLQQAVEVRSLQLEVDRLTSQHLSVPPVTGDKKPTGITITSKDHEK